MNLTELLIVAATICMEAGGEPYAGKVMVGQVIANRARLTRQSPKKVCLTPRQFSGWNDGGIKQKIRQAAASPAWPESRAIAEDILKPGYKSVSPATHFYNPRLATPRWAEKMRLVGIIGNHRFYAEGEK